MKATIKRYWKFLLVVLVALGIGVLGGAVAHKMGYFSAVKSLLLSPSAQQEASDASQESEPLGSVFDRSSMQVLRFTDETATEFVPVLEADRESLSQRYALPSLERMNETDTAELMEPRQVLRRIQALGIDPETFETPEANWKDLYNSVMTSVQPLAEATGETAVFDGSTAGELNRFLAGNPGGTVEVVSPTLTMDETILVPSGVVLHGNGVRLTAGAEVLDKAIVMDGVENTAVTGVVITEGCRYGIYVKNSRLYYLADNDISGTELKGITVMGDNSRFAIVNNEVHGNGNGAVYLHPDMIRRPSRLALISAVGIGGYCLLFLLFQLLRRNRKWFFRGAALLTAVFCVLTTAMNIEFYYKAFSDTPASSQEIYNETIGSSQPLSNQLPYRYHFWDVMNRGMPAGLSERSSFTSTVSSSIFTFYDALGIGRHTTSEEGPDGTNELLSVRYYVTLADAPDNDAWMSYSNGSRQVNVYEDTSALPIGFCYDTYMTGSELEAVDPAERAHAMLKTLVVSDEDADKVSGVLRHYDASVDGEISGDSKAADMDRRREACSETFDYGTDFFRSEITSDTDQYAFFSVPYDKSWHATVNGEAVEILKVNGLMAVPVTAGHNTIQFRYSPTPLWIGIGLSIVSLILSLIYVKQRRPAAAH